MCMSPMEVFWNWNERKYQFVYNPRECRCSLRGIKTAIVPCGKCPECKAKWRTQLAQRVRYELDKYKDNVCFLTLTVNDDYIDEVFPDGSLSHAYFQKFMKRLRGKLDYHKNLKIKYLCCGEYGEKNGRPHFHVIIFGWKPHDLRYRGRSQKGYSAYKSDFLEEVWRAGFVDVGSVDVHTAPYMVKYMVKFAEIKGDDFELNGRKVKKPYIVYPKTVLGIDFFIGNYRQILRNGFIRDTRGKKIGIPRSFLKYAENSDNLEMQELYRDYLLRIEEYIESLDTDYEELCKQGAIRREIYRSFKNKYR